MNEAREPQALSDAGLLHKGLKPLEVLLPPELADPGFWSPREFFGGTYFTLGLRDLMVGVAGRLSGNELSAVYQLNAGSRGGKTHAILALYHMSEAGLARDIPELRELFSGVAVSLPEKINRVVITGGLRHPRCPADVSDGLAIRTLWGEIAWQLGGLGAYEIVAEHDRTGVPPGFHLFMSVLSAHSPCLILVDDWLPYLRHVCQGSERPGDALRANLNFIQSLSLGVCKAPGTVMAISDPEVFAFSDRRAQDIQAELYKIFKFAERWQPASHAEKLEIARKQLCGAKG